MVHVPVAARAQFQLGKLRDEAVDERKGRNLVCFMRPVDIQPIGEELAVKWDDGTESFVPLEKLRRCCPCAACRGEADIMGRVYENVERPFSPASFRLVRLEYIGRYAVQPVWADGHATGIYSFDYLREVAVLPEAGRD